MRNNFRLSLLVCSFAALVLAGCDSSTASGPPVDVEPTDNVDAFESNSLGSYTIYNTPGAWSISRGFLLGGTSAVQSVVIRKGATMANGWVETETDWASDGGLVLRFQGEGNYYLLAIRDDSRFGWANLEMYRAADGEFHRLGLPLDVAFPSGVRKTVRFEAIGNVLSAYLNGTLVLQATDDAYTSGGFGLRHDNTRGIAGLTSRFDLLRWPRG